MRSSLIILIIAVGLIVVGCGSTVESGDSNEDRTKCNQATDCGEEGLSKYKCYFAPGETEGLCFTHDEFCLSDAECDGSCVNNVCSGGKVDGDTDGDSGSDGDTDQEEACPYQCCSDDDCGDKTVCDLTTHTCVFETVCEYECCQPDDCLNNPNFGEGYICRGNKCVKEDAPCTEECCEDSDCMPDQTCEDNKCVAKQISCVPGKQTCCSLLPSYFRCLDLGVLTEEAVLTCNDNGNGYNLTQCPEFNSCIDHGDGSTECFYNGRCVEDSDCDCPKECIKDDNNKMRCSPKLLNAGDTCYGTPCSDEKEEIGRCPDSFTCCFDDPVTPTTGTCVAENDCNQ